MFDHVLSALPAEMVSQVIDVVDALPAAGQYEFFKNELLNIHQLSDYEKFDALVKMEPMGGRKPSQLLNAMLECCPLGMERHLSLGAQPRRRLRPPPPLECPPPSRPLLTWLELGRASTSSTGPLRTRRRSVWPPARGETRPPGTP
jgi:hypothetical protein